MHLVVSVPVSVSISVCPCVDVHVMLRACMRILACSRIRCLVCQDLELQSDDVREEFIKGSGRGGQKINKTSSRVRLTHLPTGIQVWLCLWLLFWTNVIFLVLGTLCAMHGLVSGCFLRLPWNFGAGRNCDSHMRLLLLEGSVCLLDIGPRLILPNSRSSRTWLVC